MDQLPESLVIALSVSTILMLIAVWVLWSLAHREVPKFQDSEAEREEDDSRLNQIRQFRDSRAAELDVEDCFTEEEDTTTTVVPSTQEPEPMRFPTVVTAEEAQALSNIFHRPDPTYWQNNGIYVDAETQPAAFALNTSSVPLDEDPHFPSNTYMQGAFSGAIVAEEKALPRHPTDMQIEAMTKVLEVAPNSPVRKELLPELARLSYRAAYDAHYPGM